MEQGVVFELTFSVPVKLQHVVKVDALTMPEGSVIFRYRCPETGGLVKQALRFATKPRFLRMRFRWRLKRGLANNRQRSPRC